MTQNTVNSVVVFFDMPYYLKNALHLIRLTDQETVKL